MEGSKRSSYCFYCRWRTSTSSEHLSWIGLLKKSDVQAPQSSIPRPSRASQTHPICFKCLIQRRAFLLDSCRFELRSVHRSDCIARQFFYGTTSRRGKWSSWHASPLLRKSDRRWHCKAPCKPKVWSFVKPQKHCNHSRDSFCSASQGWKGRMKS